MAPLRNYGLLRIHELIGAMTEGFMAYPIFRGHANKDWKLIPSAFREGAAPIINNETLSKWKKVAGRFIRPAPHSDLEWLVLAQHYGIATPLLDWTTNPLIALFFACQAPTGDGCVIRASKSQFQAYDDRPGDEVFQPRLIPGIFDSSAMNDRTLAQDSVMTVHTSSCTEVDPSSIEIIFKVEDFDKGQILHYLKTLFGISSERLYSDLNTAARHFVEELEFDHRFGFGEYEDTEPSL